MVTTILPERVYLLGFLSEIDSFPSFKLKLMSKTKKRRFLVWSTSCCFSIYDLQGKLTGVLVTRCNLPGRLSRERGGCYLVKT